MAAIEVADLAAFSDADFDELTTGLGIPVGARLKLRTQFREMDKDSPVDIKSMRAVEDFCSGTGAMVVPATVDDALIVPDYKPTPVDFASRFTELENQDQRLTLLGQSMSLRTAAGGACAFFSLVIVVLVTVSFNSTNNPCVGVECGAYGTCADGSCACQPGYTGEIPLLLLPHMLYR